MKDIEYTEIYNNYFKECKVKYDKSIPLYSKSSHYHLSQGGGIYYEIFDISNK